MSLARRAREHLPIVRGDTSFPRKEVHLGTFFSSTSCGGIELLQTSLASKMLSFVVLLVPYLLIRG